MNWLVLPTYGGEAGDTVACDRDFAAGLESSTSQRATAVCAEE